MDVGHTGELITEQILQVVNDYSVTGGVISITMDNACTDEKAIAILRDGLNLFSDPFFFHSRCVTLILSLVVSQGASILATKY